MAFDFSRLAPMFAGFGGGPSAAFGVHEMQQKQRAGKLGAQARSRFYEKVQAAPPGDPAALQAAIMAGVHDIQSNPELAAADPDLMNNLLTEAKNLQELMQAQQPEYINTTEGIFATNPAKPGELTMVHQAMPAALREMAAIAGDPETAKRMLMAEHQTKTDLMRAQTQAALRGPQPTAAQDALRAKMALVPTLEAKGVSPEAIQLWLSGQMELRQVQQTDMQGQSITRNMLVPTAPGFDAVEIPGQPALPQPDTSGLVQPSPESSVPAIPGLDSPKYGNAAAFFGEGLAPAVTSTVGSVARQAGAQESDVGLAQSAQRFQLDLWTQSILGLHDATNGKILAAEAERLTKLIEPSVLKDPGQALNNAILLRRELERRLTNFQAEAEGALDKKSRQNALGAAQAVRGVLATLPTYDQIQTARTDYQSGTVDLSLGAAEQEIERGVSEAVNGDSAPKAPPVGTVEQGYRFKGGDPADQNNWEKVK